MSTVSVPFGMDLASLPEISKDAILRGQAPIKADYLKPEVPRSAPVSRKDAVPNGVEAASGTAESTSQGAGGAAVNVTADGSTAAEPAEAGSKRKRGQNKKRDRTANVDNRAGGESEALCQIFAASNSCPRENCRFSHDVEKYYTKEKVSVFPNCRFYDRHGICPYGLNCLAANAHLSEDLKNLDRSTGKPVEGRKIDIDDVHKDELNHTSMDTKVTLRKKLYPMPNIGAGGVAKKEIREKRCDINLKEAWKGKTILAPLTTVGNLPFRRLCVKLGCDITVSEMALAQSILEGNKSEHALLQRHESEKYFGIQLAGGYADTLSRCTDFLVNSDISFDFLDLNMACPLEGLHRKGAGSALMAKTNRMEEIVKSVAPILATKNIPLTCKIRTAHLDSKKLLGHKLAPRFCELGVNGMIIHGRTAQQRYTKLADWEYLGQTTRAVPEAFRDRFPVYGCGDILSYEDWEQKPQAYGVDGCLVARGALIKPWIFTEIQERRHWDISASERLDLLKTFVDFGLDHWGTDRRGLETTRRFLLEELSFQYRYIPVGLLDVVPQQINWRPPAYLGRSDLETLLASPNSQDWVRISEMLLGPVPENFVFVPKHKSNSYAAPVEGLGLREEDGSVAKKLKI